MLLLLINLLKLLLNWISKSNPINQIYKNCVVTLQSKVSFNQIFVIFFGKKKVFVEYKINEDFALNYFKYFVLELCKWIEMYIDNYFVGSNVRIILFWKNLSAFSQSILNGPDSCLYF